MHGSVTCGSERVATGRVSFAPIEGTAGRICAATIVDGQYHIDAQGGVPLGDYRVEVERGGKRAARSKEIMALNRR